MTIIYSAISYEQAKEVLPSASHIFVGVTPDDIEAYPFQKYVSRVQGVAVLGGDEPFALLAAKEVFPAPVPEQEEAREEETTASA